MPTIARTKAALEELLRTHNRTARAPLRCSGDRALSSFASGISVLDRYWGGGIPRGQVSEIWGAPSSGRTALALVIAASAIRSASDVAWIDPQDSLDPSAAQAVGVDLERLFWMRKGTNLERILSATATLVGSGIFELVVLDVCGLSSRDLLRLPAATWRRFQRLVEGRPVALLLLGAQHLFRGPLGLSLSLRGVGHRWQGDPGPGRLLRGVVTQATLGMTRSPLASPRLEIERLAGR